MRISHHAPRSHSTPGLLMCAFLPSDSSSNPLPREKKKGEKEKIKSTLCCPYTYWSMVILLVASCPVPMPQSLPVPQCSGLSRSRPALPRGRELAVRVPIALPESPCSGALRFRASSPLPTDITMASGSSPNHSHPAFNGNTCSRHQPVP